MPPLLKKGLFTNALSISLKNLLSNFFLFKKKSLNLN